ncbi:hypothetical protein M427DRAFT_494701 [Gonapodya prolifera JEL478]|uniref:Uncharacterized protein n=1 Tax=Gonapodya prolifera (strain JEL478) TaxID=1344416 RepID=A0A138ZWN5_GONPJ|nr:hypothetical protein M427DRAFT_494701 [Gonapodya prolifera JEL478]|eukprot:KXS08864.1 hypothetical protein M427DRAFT_494701 [Gonapodya prolifera JEL478]
MWKLNLAVLLSSLLAISTSAAPRPSVSVTWVQTTTKIGYVGYALYLDNNCQIHAGNWCSTLSECLSVQHDSTYALSRLGDTLNSTSIVAHWSLFEHGGYILGNNAWGGTLRVIGAQPIFVMSSCELDKKTASAIESTLDESHIPFASTSSGPFIMLIVSVIAYFIIAVVGILVLWLVGFGIYLCFNRNERDATKEQLV